MFYIDDKIAYEDYKDYLKSKPCILNITDDVIKTTDHVVKVLPEYADLLNIAEGLKSEKVDFDISEYSTAIVENQGYKFITFENK